MKTLLKRLLFVALLLAGPFYHEHAGSAQTGNIVNYFSLQSAATTTGVGTAANIGGYPVLGIEVSITNTATVAFQGLMDANWSAAVCVPMGGGTPVTQATASGFFRCPTVGLQQFRANITACTTCTVTVRGVASAEGLSLFDTITANQGTANATPWNVNVQQWLGSTAPTVGQKTGANSIPVVPASDVNAPVNYAQVAGATTSTGQGTPDAGTQRVFGAQKATYVGATTTKTATAAGTGPFFSICGSATKTVRIQQIIIGGTVATAAVYGDVELTKTSATTSGGTATALTKVPHDSNSAASTVNLLNYYTALATAGSAVGKIGSQSAVFPLTGTVAASEANVIFDWTQRREAEAPVLRGTAQCVEASFGTTTTNAPTLTVSTIWTEE